MKLFSHLSYLGPIQVVNVTYMVRQVATKIHENAFTHVNKLKQLQGKNIWLMGGGKLTQLLLGANLIDELIITIVPILLGEGIPLFPKSIHKKFSDLVDIQRDSGLSMLTYYKKKES